MTKRIESDEFDKIVRDKTAESVFEKKRNQIRDKVNKKVYSRKNMVLWLQIERLLDKE